MKTIVGAALALAFAMASAAQGADLNGNGAIADLEERIAELEATTARKNNRKVSLTIYGQINKAIVWHDADVPDSIAKRTFGDGSQNPTVFGFTGEAKTSPEVKAGFRLEFGVDENAVLQDTITVRHSAIWVESIKLGRATIGRTSQATDGIAEMTVANTDVAAKMLNLEPVSTHYFLGAVNLPFDGGRRNIVRYDTPVIAGFMASASWGQGDRIGPFGVTSNEAVYDLALRYAGEFGGFRVTGGVGYRVEDYNAAGALAGIPMENVITGSASAKHLVSGIFANVAAGKVTNLGGTTDLQGLHVQGGWEHNVTTLGNTTLFAEWGQLKEPGASGDITLMGLGAVQAVDAAALDLYATWRQFDLDGADKVNVWMLGTRIRF